MVCVNFLEGTVTCIFKLQQRVVMHLIQCLRAATGTDVREPRAPKITVSSPLERAVSSRFAANSGLTPPGNRMLTPVVNLLWGLAYQAYQ